MYYFDHGTQYITAKDTVVQKFIEKWEEMGIVAEWKGKFGTYDASSKIFVEDSVCIFTLICCWKTHYTGKKLYICWINVFLCYATGFS